MKREGFGRILSSHRVNPSPASSIPVVHVQPTSTSSGLCELRRVIETPSSPYEARGSSRVPFESRTVMPIDWGEEMGGGTKEGRGRRWWIGVGM